MFHLVKQILSDRSTYQTCQLHFHFDRTIKVFFLRDLDQGKLIFKHIPKGKDISRFPWLSIKINLITNLQLEFPWVYERISLAIHHIFWELRCDRDGVELILVRKLRYPFMPEKPPGWTSISEEDLYQVLNKSRNTGPNTEMLKSSWNLEDWNTETRF